MNITALLGWVSRYAKGLTAAAGALITILSAVYAGHSPHWLTWVIGLATALGVVMVPNKAKEPLELLIARIIRAELDKPVKAAPGGGTGGSA
jgi:hypothetical protein